MSTYEIDDDVVRGLVDNRDLLPPRLLTAMAALEEQIPIPAPTLPGAVVVNEHGALMVLADAGASQPWWNNSQKVWSEITGRIAKVLSEGVES